MCAAGILFARVSAAELAPDHVEFFESKIRPILAKACYSCHSEKAEKIKGGLSLDTRAGVLLGGNSGPAIVPGDPDKSLLIQAVRYTDPDFQMPPADDYGKLPAEQIALLEQWVKMGAPDPRTGGKAHPMDMAAARRHWAFQPVVKPAPPAPKNSAWVRTPVDAFVLAQLEAKQLAPAPAADARTLLRRVTYDLTGLPPTADEVDAFVAASARDPEAAYTAAVDRLLASPRHGERWGRFWLDVARYADTKGYLAGNVERRYAFSHTYRDYVIAAFNADKPFDQFIVEQLAADQLPLGDDKSALAAMGFLTLGRRFLNNQNDIIDDRIDVVTRGLMGLTVACARCHDHKFDPIPTKDYYSLHGIFASSEEPEEKPLLGPLVDSPAYQEFLKKKAAAQEKVAARARSEVETFLAGVRAKTGDYLLGAHDAARLRPDEKFDLFAGTRKLNPEVLKRYQRWLDERAKEKDPVLAPWFAFAALPEKDFAAAAIELIARWKEKQDDAGSRANANPFVVDAFIKAEKPPESLKDVAAIYNRAFADVDQAWKSAVDAAAKAKAAAPAALEDPAQEAVRHALYADGAPANLSYESTAAMIKRQIDDKTSGLRREVEALNWTEPGAPLRGMALVDKARPANSRVMLRGNPGSRGPEVPRQFLEILSDGPRHAATHTSGRLELARAIADPKNPLTARVLVNRVWGWHFGASLVATPSDFGVRTPAPVHAALLDWLAASFVEHGWSLKQLHRAIVLSNTYRQSSEPSPRAAALDPDNALVHRFARRRLEFEALRDTLLAAAGTLELGGGGLPDDLTKEPFARRRTVYGFIDRQNLPGMFRTFDYPNPDVSAAQRLHTTVPQQALFMLNSPFVQEQARALAARPEIAAARNDAERVRALYRVTLQRAPAADELALATAFLARPAPIAEARAIITGGWQYGRGRYDVAAQRVREFEWMSVRQDGRVMPSEKFPDPEDGHVHLSAVGGHPGKTRGVAAIRRWVAPGAGTLQIDGTLGHAASAGDGVHGVIVSSERGRLGEWTVHGMKATTKLDDVRVVAGETIDFVVDCIESDNSDAFTWAPTLTFTGEGETPSGTWNARKDFDVVPKHYPPLTRAEELAQVLLLSNELAFVD